MGDFNQAFDYMIQYEGTQFVDNPDDKGGPTKFGISERFIFKNNFLPSWSPLLGDADNSNGYEWVASEWNGENNKDYIRNLNIESAKLIYQKYFWLPIYEQIGSQQIANYIFDMTVQHGRGKAAELTQRAINSSYAQASHCHVIVDAKFGKDTLNSINSIINEKIEAKVVPCSLGIRVFRSALIAVRESLFRCIVAHYPSQKQFLDGWLKRAYGEKL